ncbi:MAG: hypothetical protein WCG15_00280 [Actinomycetes bacterium]
MFAADDLDLDSDSLKDQQIAQLRKEVARARALLNVPQSLQKSIGLAAIGSAMGLGSIGTAIGGLVGFKMGQAQELTPQRKLELQNILQRKSAQLKALERSGEIEGRQITGIMNASDLLEYKYDCYTFTGKYGEFFGNPSKNFHLMVFGRPKNGKSIFTVQFAKYLATLGKVLYIASEEGFSATLQQKIREFGMANPNLDFGNFRDFEQIRETLVNNHYNFVVIDSINFINLEPEDVEVMKAENPKTAFITIQQATKGGQFRGSQQFAHNCDMIVEIIDGVAYHQGRFAAPSEMAVFTTPFDSNSKKVGEGSKKKESSANATQIDLFGSGNESDQYSDLGY